MSKKPRGKSGGGGGSATAVGGNKWETGLMTTNFYDDSWSAMVVFIIPNQQEDGKNIDVLLETVSLGQRRLFSMFTKESLIKEVHELGNPKVKKAKDVPAFYEVCEPVKQNLDNNEPINPLLMAKLLKFKLLSVKTQDLRRREEEKKAADAKAKGTPAAKPAKGAVGKPKSAAGKKGKKTPEPPAPKKETKLKKRGEDDEDKKYIDDEPDDGVQHYIFVYGFTDAILLQTLSDAGINIDCVLKFCSENYPIVTQDETTLEDNPLITEQREKNKAEIEKFWRESDPVLRRAGQSSKLHDTARLTYTPKGEKIPLNLDDNEARAEFGTDVYEEVACMLYDMLDWKRQYHTYLENLKLFHVPCIKDSHCALIEKLSSTPLPEGATPQPHVTEDQSPDIDIEDLTNDVDLRFYADMINSVPHESVSVPLIMHCMLEQISATEQSLTPPSEAPSLPRDDGMNPDLAEHFTGAVFKLALTESEKLTISQQMEAKKGEQNAENSVQKPVVIHYHDNIAYRTRHLKTLNDFDVLKAEQDMMYLTPSAALCNFPQPTSLITKDRAARLQELIHHCSSGFISQAELDHAFKQFVFECLRLKGTDCEGRVVDADGLFYEGDKLIPWDDPYPFYVHLEKSLTELRTKNKPTSRPVSVLETSPEPLPEPPVQRTPSPPKSPKSSRKSGRGRTTSPKSRPASGSGKKDSSKERHDSAVSKTSVHFIKQDDEESSKQADKHEEQGAITPVTSESRTHVPTTFSFAEVSDIQQRNLDDWCYSENFKPHVLLQVLEEARYHLPYMDTYYNKKDNCLLVVLHAPQGPEKTNVSSWSTFLHADVGFRNYLEHVSEKVTNWVTDEEVKYQAERLEKERLLSMTPKPPEEPSPTKGRPKSGRSPSPKKSRGSSAKRSGSESPSKELEDQAKEPQVFMRPESMKAWKVEQDKVKEAEEKKAKEKESKNAASPKKGGKGSAGSRSGSALREPDKKHSEMISDLPTTIHPDEIKTPEKIYPFSGYNLGNDLSHVTGSTSMLFPADGGQIRVEKNEMIGGRKTVKTTLLKNGHSFTVHLIDPKCEVEDITETELDGEEGGMDEGQCENGEEKGETEQPEKIITQPRTDVEQEEGTDVSVVIEDTEPLVSQFGSFVATLSDGIVMSLSNYGNSGKPKNANMDEVKIDIPIPPPVQISPQPPASPPGKKSGKKKEDPLPPPPEPIAEEEKSSDDVDLRGTSDKPDQPFQQLNITCPDGLALTFFLESSVGIADPTNDDARRLLVRQSYPVKTAGKQDCESIRAGTAMKENSRVVTSEGTIIKTMCDGTTEVLYADGTKMVTESQIFIRKSTAVLPSTETNSRAESAKPDSPVTGKKHVKSGRKTSGNPKQTDPPPTDDADSKIPPEPMGPEWTITTPSGDRCISKPDGSLQALSGLQYSTAADPESLDVMITREDRVHIVNKADNTLIVDYEDGTRVTKFLQGIYTNDRETGELVEGMVEHVKVECVGYATLVFNKSDSSCTAQFASGTQLFIHPAGAYVISCPDGSQLAINPQGSVAFVSHPDNNIISQLCNVSDFSSLDTNLISTCGVYLLSHNSYRTVYTTDIEGNEFEVRSQGQISVRNLSNSGEEGSIAPPNPVTCYNKHAPRLFMVNCDKSGTELLRHGDINEYYTRCDVDMSTAIVWDALPNHPAVRAVTILKPFSKNPSESWIIPYEIDNVVPTGLRCRDLKTLPAQEKKSTGPRFGTKVGKGVNVGGVEKHDPPQSLKAPDETELRQLILYEPISTELRDSLFAGLKSYAQTVIHRELAADALLAQDPRTEEERLRAVELAEISPKQAIGVDDTSTIVEPINIPTHDDLAKTYEDAVAPPAVSPPQVALPRRSADEWDCDKMELAQETKNQAALRSRRVPGYFHSVFGQEFMKASSKLLDTLAEDLPENIRRAANKNIDVFPARISQSPGTPEDERKPLTPVSEMEQPKFVLGTGNSDRPDNPTPLHAAGVAKDKRPCNPTPAHASQPGSDPNMPPPSPDTDDDLSTPKSVAAVMTQTSLVEDIIPEVTEPSSDGYDGGLVSGASDFEITQSLLTNVIGQPRQYPVPLPNSIQGARPGGLVNEKFIKTEDPVRRKVYTSSIAGSINQGQTQMIAMRGFVLIPEQINFGLLKEGCTYRASVNLKNVGIDSCRYKISQPPPSTGLKIIYKPGSVAAGMSTKLSIEVYAIAAGVEGQSGEGSIDHAVEIISETDIMHLPVTAIVLTAQEYDQRFYQMDLSSTVGSGVTVISTRPSSRQSITRPRKFTDQDPVLQQTA